MSAPRPDFAATPLPGEDGLPELANDDATYIANLGVALSHPVRARIVALQAEHKSALSPKQIAKALLLPLGTVAYHVRYLRNLGFLELVREVPRRGAIEHYYGLAQSLRQAVKLLLAELPGETKQAEHDGEITEWAAQQLMRRGKALGHPLRAHTAAFLIRVEDASATTVAAAVRATYRDADVGNVAYHMRVLEKHGFLRRTRTKPVRGTFVKLYALRPPIREALATLAKTVDPKYAAFARSPADQPEKATQSFGRNLAYAREGAGLEVAAVAETCGITEEELLQIEAGERDPSGRLLATLAKAVGLGVADLYD